LYRIVKQLKFCAAPVFDTGRIIIWVCPYGALVTGISVKDDWDILKEDFDVPAFTINGKILSPENSISVDSNASRFLD